MSLDVDTLAASFLERAAESWEKNGLPKAAFATACTVYGLQTAAAEEGPEEVAAGLQRMADAIMESAPVRQPRHLI